MTPTQCWLPLNIDRRDPAGPKRNRQCALPNGTNEKRHRIEYPTQDPGTDLRNTIPITRRENARVRVIKPDGHIPISPRLATIQLLQVSRRKFHVRLWVERLIQGRERLGVDLQINLQASDVNKTVTRLLLIYPHHSRCLAFREQPLAISINGPGPCTNLVRRSNRPATLDFSHRCQQSRRKVMPFLRFLYRRVALLALRHVPAALGFRCVLSSLGMCGSRSKYNQCRHCEDSPQPGEHMSCASRGQSRLPFGNRCTFLIKR